MAFFRFFFFVSLSIFVLESAHSIKTPNLPCRMRNSNYCKYVEYFKKDLKDGCASITGNCRKKFCQYNCFSTQSPGKDTQIYNLCKKNCDPYPHKVISIISQEGVPLTDQQKALFKERFEDSQFQNSKEVEAYLQSLFSQINSDIPWCEGECKYNENQPKSCQTNHKNPKKLWKACAQRCHFLTGIKTHAEHCANKPEPKPRPQRTQEYRGQENDF